MSTLKNIVFEDIRSDYLKNGSESFLYRYLRNGKLKERCDKEPKKEKALIHKAATDLMYNQGYPLAKPTVGVTDYANMKDGVSEKDARRRSAGKGGNGKSGKGGAGKDEKTLTKPRSHNTLLELIEAWYEDKDADSKVFIDVSDYQTMYDELNNCKRTQALIPVKVDRMTGAGLYIVGRENCPADRFPYDERHSCGLCILSDWILPEEGDGVCLNYGVYANEDLGACDSVEEALRFFDNYMRNNSDDYFAEIREMNGNMPDNTPEGLKKYFANYFEDDPFTEITEEDMAETKKELGL